MRHVYTYLLPGLGFGKPTFGNPLATPQLPGSGLFEPLGPNVPIGPSEPTFGDPGLVGGILNSPPVVQLHLLHSF